MEANSLCRTNVCIRSPSRPRRPHPRRDWGCGMTAPERIWAEEIGTATKGGQAFRIGRWITDESASHPDEYVRRDPTVIASLPEVQALVMAERERCARIKPGALHCSFPEAGDGRPMSVMGDTLMTAGLSADDARFVAVQLEQNGWTLAPIAQAIRAETEGGE